MASASPAELLFLGLYFGTAEPQSEATLPVWLAV
jgi:hypothetical protein